MLVSVHIGADNSYTWAKWKLVADAALKDEFAFWMREEAGKWIFLVSDDRELLLLQAALGIERIKYGIEENVELSTQEKQHIENAQITDQSQVESVLARALRIGAATTIGELKEELLNDPRRVSPT